MSTEERLGYAHTLAHELARRAVKAHEYGATLAGTQYTRTQCANISREAWRRYDRVTRWIYNLEKHAGYW